MGTGTITANTAPTQGVTTTVGPRYSTTAADGGGISTLWTNPSNVKVSDNTNATFAARNSTTSNYLNTSNYGFSIPSNATITGISVSCIENLVIAVHQDSLKMQI